MAAHKEARPKATGASRVSVRLAANPNVADDRLPKNGGVLRHAHCSSDGAAFSRWTGQFAG